MPLEGPALGHFLAARAGKLTASRMLAAMSFRKDGKSSAERNNLMRDLLAERLTGDSVRHYVTTEMQWGLDYEDDAKAAYEAETGNLLEPCSFVEHPTIEYCGATSDALLAPDGLFECKCPTTGKFVDWVMAGAVPEEHKPQMILQCACYRRPWCEFVAYDPRIKDHSRRLFIRRYVPSAEEIGAVEEAAVQFLIELDAMFDAFTAAPA